MCSPLRTNTEHERQRVLLRQRRKRKLFASLKRETFPRDCCFDTKAEARLQIFDYIETFYNH